jgi:hypothetical protein
MIVYLNIIKFRVKGQHEIRLWVERKLQTIFSAEFNYRLYRLQSKP